MPRHVGNYLSLDGDGGKRDVDPEILTVERAVDPFEPAALTCLCKRGKYFFLVLGGLTIGLCVRGYLRGPESEDLAFL
ncbi:MAG: hypothetical protein A4E58_01832 [Syntrophorhabdus sp. PtaB.Bin006]|nr:MAG: hypothetical protein A4E58_01832 [Syntrophorhabdus sp. PtaB.Bin006]